MSQSSTSSQYRIKWEKQTTFDCEICLATNTRQLLELPCGHNVKNIFRTFSVSYF